ncbi:MAG TPA: hypothetical protein VFQ63_00375, partial [Patescibacteria group bacterium]|nr:hypothetical protein [Patescibacteria group bacterium]
KYNLCFATSPEHQDFVLRHYKIRNKSIPEKYKKSRALLDFFLQLRQPKIIIEIDYVKIIQAFQDLRYIGEMRQRWGEIKKLQNNKETF